MLILTRRVGETLKIGDDVDITVLGVKRQSDSHWDHRSQARGCAPGGDFREDQATARIINDEGTRE